jgi:hypothetical protein
MITMGGECIHFSDALCLTLYELIDRLLLSISGILLCYVYHIDAFTAFLAFHVFTISDLRSTPPSAALLTDCQAAYLL